MAAVNMPAKRHAQWLPSCGAAAVDGADGERRRRRPFAACQKELKWTVGKAALGRDVFEPLRAGVDL